MTSVNPFLSVSLLPYQAPRFDLIEDAHYRPAFDEGVKRKREEIAAIADNPQPASFENTFVALEKSGALLGRVTSVFFAMAAAHTNDALQKLDEEFSSELAALGNDIWLNDKLFARVDKIWHEREKAGLDAESFRLVELTHQHFILAGAEPIWLMPGAMAAKEKKPKGSLEPLSLEISTINLLINRLR